GGAAGRVPVRTGTAAHICRAAAKTAAQAATSHRPCPAHRWARPVRTPAVDRSSSTPLHRCGARPGRPPWPRVCHRAAVGVRTAPLPRAVRRRDRPGGSVLRIGAARLVVRRVLVVAGPGPGVVVRGVVVVVVRGLGSYVAVIAVVVLGVGTGVPRTVARSTVVVLGIGVLTVGVHVCVIAVAVVVLGAWIVIVVSAGIMVVLVVAHSGGLVGIGAVILRRGLGAQCPPLGDQLRRGGQHG